MSKKQILITSSFVVFVHLLSFKLVLSELIGVPLERLSLYESTSDGQFRCLDGSGTIPFSFVNDNYCDCGDSSDEPGTSACPNGVFYCANRGYVERYIPSGLINDGLCDCCDGSDEYNSTAQCPDSCDQLGTRWREEQEKLKELAQQGAEKRTQYKLQAQQQHEQDNQQLATLKQELTDKEQTIRELESRLQSDFGPDRVFLPLKGKCFKFEDREYTYTLCPFDRATQESNTGMQTELGRWGSWAGPQDNLYSIQKYEGGYQCWNGPARSVVVYLRCGSEDQVLSASEPARCEYMFEFSTPAACPSLEPPPSEQQEQAENDSFSPQEGVDQSRATQPSDESEISYEQTTGQLEHESNNFDELDSENEHHDHGLDDSDGSEREHEQENPHDEL